MFCSKCGKTIDDNATFCGFCGAPQTPAPQTGAPQYAAPQNNAPQYGAPQNNVPQYGAPQNGAPQYGAPQYGAPQNGMYPNQAMSGFSLNLEPKLVDIINKSLRGALILLGILTLIGAIGSMGSAGAIVGGNFLAAMNVEGFYNLARVPAIIAFSLSVLGLGFTIFTKQRSLFSYISAAAGLILFIFNFVMYGGYVTFAKSLLSLKPNIAGIVVSGIFLIIGALALIAASLVIILKKEDIIKFKPKF